MWEFFHYFYIGNSRNPPIMNKKVVGPLKSVIAGCSCNLNHEPEVIIAFLFSFLMTYTGAIMIEKVGMFHFEKSSQI